MIVKAMQKDGDFTLIDNVMTIKHRTMDYLNDTTPDIDARIDRDKEGVILILDFGGIKGGWICLAITEAYILNDEGKTIEKVSAVT